MTMIPALLLASNSPRRRQLLSLGGWSFDTDVSNVDETLIADESPVDYVRRLALKKAHAVLPRARSEHVIIGSDTTVVIEGDILGKPADDREARQMLQRLRGKTHQVYTGIALLRASDGTFRTDVVVTDVPMRAYSSEEIDSYILTGDPLDKAGAYGIQNPNFQPVAQMDGCYASVMGLPLCSLSALLRHENIHALSNVAQNCQAAIQYECPVYESYLHGNLGSLR